MAQLLEELALDPDHLVDSLPLTPREEKVLKLRFGIEDGRTRTLEEVGKEFNVTRERIRQIEAKALRKLRHPSRSKKLKDFLSGMKSPRWESSSSPMGVSRETGSWAIFKISLIHRQAVRGPGDAVPGPDPGGQPGPD